MRTGVILLLGLACAGLLLACSRKDEPGREEPAATDHRTPAAASDGTPPGGEFATAEGESRDHPGAELPDAALSAATTRAAQPGSDSLRSDARDVIDELLSLDWAGGASPDDPRVSALLRQLQRQGIDALVPIRDLLLDAETGASVPSALRQALLEVLLSLGVPQVEEAALELLAGGLPPAELWQVGHYLESVQPGGYTDLFLQAAERALIEAGPETYFPAEFFLLVGVAGDSDTALVLAETHSERGAHASLALASLPDGIGLPLLERDARLFETGQDTLQGRLAIQLLAQHAPYSSAAAAVLVELAERGAIPHDVWPYVLDLVAGRWVLTMDPPTSGLVGSHTYYRPEGNQVIYRVAPAPGVDDLLQDERQSLLDRLRALAPAGVEVGLDG